MHFKTKLKAFLKISNRYNLDQKKILNVKTIKKWNFHKISYEKNFKLRRGN